MVAVCNDINEAAGAGFQSMSNRSAIALTHDLTRCLVPHSLSLRNLP